MASDLSKAAIEAAVRGRLGRSFQLMESTDSTNRVALEWAASGAADGALVVADHQTAGRGRRGRSWVSEKGSALLFSVVLRPIGTVELLTTVLGVATAEAIESVTGLPAAIKWPNDVTIRGRKVAGILVETRVQGGRVDAVVAGIGVNVAWPAGDFPPEIAARATSISAEVESGGSGRVPSRPELLGAILLTLEKLLSQPDDDVLKRAAARSDVIGRRVVVAFAGGRVLEGVARRLTPNGALEIEADEATEVVTAGEIEQLRPE